MKNESLFYWRVYPDGKAELDSGVPARKPILDDIHGGYPSFYPAFTSSELGEMLPWSLTIGAHYWELLICKNGTKTPWYCAYENIDDEEDGRERIGEFKASTEADARALCLIHLLETGIVKNEV